MTDTRGSWLDQLMTSTDPADVALNEARIARFEQREAAAAERARLVEEAKAARAARKAARLKES